MHNDGELFVKNTDFQNPKTQRKTDKKSLNQRLPDLRAISQRNDMTRFVRKLAK